MVVDDPTKLLASGFHAGFEWNIIHNGIGYRCGYVRLPSGHPWYGADIFSDGAPDPNVHGGLTFADYDKPCGNGDDNGYWIGFDCAHGWDAIDPELPGGDWIRRMGIVPWVDGDRAIRTTEYVRKECESLCEQASAAMTKRLILKLDVKVGI